MGCSGTEIRALNYDIGSKSRDTLKGELSLNRDFCLWFPPHKVKEKWTDPTKQKKSASCDIFYILHIYFYHLHSLSILSLLAFFGLNYLSAQFYIYALLSFASIHVIVCYHICYYMMLISFYF